MSDDQTWLLSVEAPAECRMEFELPAGVKRTVGRGEKSDFCIPLSSSAGFSKLHCEVEGAPDGVRIRDLPASYRAPAIDGKALAKGGEGLAADGALVELGSVRLRVRRRGAAEAQPPAADPHATGIWDTRAFDPALATAPAAPLPRGTDVTREGAQGVTGRSFGETIMVPLDDIRRWLSQEKAGDRKRRMLLLLLAAVGLLAIGMLAAAVGRGSSPGNACVQVALLKDALSVTAPAHWRLDARNRVVYLHGRTWQGLDGLAVVAVENADVRWWNFRKAGEACLAMLCEDLSGLSTDGMAQALLADDGGRLVLRQVADGCTGYVPCSWAAGEGRLFLDDGRALLCFVPCSDAATARQAAAGLLDTLSPGSNAVAGVFIDRRPLADEDRPMRLEEARQLLNEARIFHDNRWVSPGNGWKSYRMALRVYRWLGGAPEGAGAPEELRTATWDQALAAARFLNERYRMLKIDILRANAGGRTDDGARLAALLQDEFPDRSDYRWQWAQKQRIEGQAHAPKRKGLF